MRDKEKKKNVFGDGPVIRIDKEVLKNYGGKICPKCGREYDKDADPYCTEDAEELYPIWKCRHCGEDLTKAQGYSAIKVCPSCGKALDAMQKKSINGTKSGEPYILKRICPDEKCGKIYTGTEKFCGKCRKPIVSMQCSCGENFRKKEDGSFDKYCPVCGKPNPVEQEKQRKAAEEALKKKKEEQERIRKQQEEERKQAEARRIAEEKERQHREWINNLKAGDIIKFGIYPYEEDGTEKPIEWQILEKYSDGTALVISKYGLDAVRFDGSSNNWEKSEIRKWLNKEFYNRAFKNVDKSLIMETRLEQTSDKMFLLSIKEAKTYFSSDKRRRCYPTPYAQTDKTKTGRPVYTNAEYGGSCWWWLRSPGDSRDGAADVDIDGYVGSIGSRVLNDDIAVRVAFKINLKNL